MRRTTIGILALLLLMLTMLGCGGGGSASGGGAGSAQVNAFATDSINDDFDHVWVKLYKLELVGDTQKFTVFEDAAGRDVDLKSLRDATGPKFSFLDTASIPAGTYKQVNVTLAKDVVLFPKGATTGQTKQFDDRFDAPDAGKSLLVMNAPGLIVAGKVDVVVDFDLATWILQANGRVNAFLKRHNGQGLGDEHRHVHDDFHGSVSGLAGTAPNFTFTLSRGNGRSFTVQTDGTTHIYKRSGADNPQLANGQRVEVAGAFVAGVLIASSIKIEDGAETEDPHKIKGTASNIDATAGEFDVTISRAFGFSPTQETYRVKTSATTRFMSDTGAILTKADFFAQLATNATVEVEGTAGNGGVFTAKKAKLETENESHEAEIKGPITAMNAAGFTITVQRWENVSLNGGESINVTFAPNAVFRLGRNTVTQAQFMAGVAVGTKVEAKGSLSGNALTAIRVKDDN